MKSTTTEDLFGWVGIFLVIGGAYALHVGLGWILTGILCFLVSLTLYLKRTS